MLNEEQAWVFTGCLLIVVLWLLWSQSRWHLLQGVIFMAVVCSNIYWKWTDNTYVAALIGAVCAYIVSAIVLKLIDPKCCGHVLLRHEGRDQTPPPLDRIAERERHLLRTDRR